MQTQQTEANGGINNQKIANMLKLQQLLHNKFLSVQLLHELISLYTCVIEYLDESQSSLRFYFLEKIQFALSRPEVQTLLESVNNTNDRGLLNNLRETLRITGKQQIAKHINPEKRKINVKILSKYNGEKQEQKKKKINLQLQLMHQVENNMKKLKNELQDTNNFIANQKNLINFAAEQQENRFKQRLQMRRKFKKRKNSFDDKDKSEVRIDKNYLLEAQKDISEAVFRITTRLTKRQILKDSHQIEPKAQKKQQKTVQGRVKKMNRLNDSDYQ